LLYNGEEIPLHRWAEELLLEITKLNQVLGIVHEDVIKSAMMRVQDTTKTYGHQMILRIKVQGYIGAHMNLAKQYKQHSFEQRFIFKGYECLELSTQILLKEAVKRGIKIEVIDWQENFITLTRENQVEYVKQATKTSKDNYVSILMMENKTVTKKILKNQGISVPTGMEILSEQQLRDNWWKYQEKAIVLKPKSTNFGLGISIFTQPTTIENV